MSDIVAFLSARLEEDQAAIEAPESWTEGDEHRGLRRVEVDESFEWVVASTLSWRGSHIARHDPPRVLREVKAKRELIEGWRRHFEWYMRDENDEAAGAAWAAMDNVLVTLAGAYRTHPDYAGDQVGDWAWPDPDDKARRADAT